MQQTLHLLLKNRRVKFFIGILLLFLVIVLLVSFFTTGRLVINTTTGSFITLSKIENNTEGQDITTVNQRSLSYFGGVGKYLVTVGDKISSTKRIVEIKPHETITYNINPNNISRYEPVIPSGSYDIFANNNFLKYLDIDSGQLLKLSGENSQKPTPIATGTIFSNVGWQNSESGIAQESNTKRLYKITGDSASVLNVPFEYSSQAVSFAIANENTFYISSGASIYITKDNGITYRKIYTTKSSDPTFNAASNGNLLIKDRSKEKGNGEDASGESILTIINSGGTKISEKQAGIYEASWSPNGKLLAISGDSMSGIFDTKFNKLGSFTQGNVNSVGWLDNNTIYFGVSSNLWKYELSSKNSTILAKAPLNGYVSGIYPDQNKSFLYLTSSTNDGYVTGRINIKNATQKPNYYHSIGIFFPAKFRECSYSYTNFKTPTIIIEPSSSSSCSEYLSGLLKEDGLLVSNFQIVER